MSESVAGMPSVSLDKLRDICDTCEQLYVETEDGGAWSALLIGRERTFVDVYSTNDPYSHEFWSAVTAFLQSDKGSEMCLPGGRYACAEALMKLQLPFFENMSAGQICHVVQLAIAQRKLLGYLNGDVVPYERSQSRVKDNCAVWQQPCGSRSPLALKLATWDSARSCLIDILEAADGQVPMSNVKRLFRSRFHMDLSETALGYTRLYELLQDKRFSDICFTRLQGNGYVVLQKVAPPSHHPSPLVDFVLTESVGKDDAPGDSVGSTSANSAAESTCGDEEALDPTSFGQGEHASACAFPQFASAPSHWHAATLLSTTPPPALQIKPILATAPPASCSAHVLPVHRDVGSLHYMKAVSGHGVCSEYGDARMGTSAWSATHCANASAACSFFPLGAPTSLHHSWDLTTSSTGGFSQFHTPWTGYSFVPADEGVLAPPSLVHDHFALPNISEFPVDGVPLTSTQSASDHVLFDESNMQSTAGMWLAAHTSLHMCDEDSLPASPVRRKQDPGFNCVIKNTFIDVALPETPRDGERSGTAQRRSSSLPKDMGSPKRRPRQMSEDAFQVAAIGTCATFDEENMYAPSNTSSDCECSDGGSEEVAHVFRQNQRFGFHADDSSFGVDVLP